MRDLGTLGGPDAFGQFINERGQVAGFSYTSSMPGPGGVPPCDPFLWDKESGMKDLGNFGGTTCDLTFKATPFHLNNRGELVGGMMTVGDATYHPFLWDGKKMIDLGTLSGDIGRANWINEASDAVGNSAYADGRLRGVLWQDHKKIEDLGTLPGDNCSDAQTINDAGRIVGTSFSYTMMGNNDGCHYASTQITSQHAVLWEDGTIIDLNTVIQPNATLTLVEAKYINDRGEIAGMGIPPGVPVSDFEFHGHVFLLIPCDDDHPDVEGCDYSMVEAAAVSSATSAARAPQSTQLSKEAVARMMGASRNPFMQRYHMPGLRPAPSN
jgi:probable HAF family extracellular repeat protein